MLRAVESGSQAAFLAPTEILVRQHLNTVSPLGRTLKDVGLSWLFNSVLQTR
jgi:RecG-like helicase